jgi:hypothetical protein
LHALQPAFFDAARPCQLSLPVPQAVKKTQQVGTLSRQFYDVMVRAGLAAAKKHRKSNEQRAQRNVRNFISLVAAHDDKFNEERGHFGCNHSRYSWARKRGHFTELRAHQ